uniref:BTB domain-containing protein n=1 Tax=Gibberella zeae TaxID=5518 RepID=A0A4E9EDV3_GIBZA
MSTTTRITIDDEGDTLIILKLRSDDSNPDVTDIIATADESTIETTTETTATSNVTTDDAVQSEDRPHTEEHFLCSKKHLSFASRRASKMFSSNFKEASKEEDGLHHWTFEALFQPTAFEIVLNFIHGKTQVSLDLLADIVSIVDDLECHDALSFPGRNWLLKCPAFCLLLIANKSTYQIIHASFVFENSEAFKRATKLAIQFGTDIVPTFELPIRQSVIESVHISRTYGWSKLLAQEPGACTYDCRSMMLGTLIQGMNAARIWPPPLPPFPSPSISTVIFSLRGIHLHTYFGPESGAYASIFSGKWHRATSSLPIQRQDNASAAPEHPQRKFAVATGTAGRIYSGTSMTPQNPTPTQGSRSPWPNVGGNTGTVTPFWGHNGLTPSAAATESQEGPPTLVQHHCCLMDCLKPMLDAVEGKIEGLKLEEFTRP